MPHIVVAGSIVGAYLWLDLWNDAKRLMWKFTAAVMSAMVATLSSGQGLLVWPAGLLPLLLAPLPKRRTITLMSIWVPSECLNGSCTSGVMSNRHAHPPLGFSLKYFATLGGGASFPYLSRQPRPVLSFPAEVQINQFGLDKQSGAVTAAGWAVDKTGPDLVGGVYLEVDGKLYATYYGINRDDVAEALKSKGSLNTDRLKACGFMRVFSLAQLGPNPHRLVMKVLNKERTAFFKPGDSVYFNIAP